MSDLSLPLWFGLLYSGVFGAIVGSYLNVVIYRIPRGMSTFWPRSRCPGCDRNIAWFDNVPIVSYVVLRGRCRRCATPISARYPIIEAATALLFVAAFAKFQWSWSTPIAFVLLSILLSLALIDAENLLLPDAITLPGLLFGLAVSQVSGITTPLQAGLGAVFGAVVLLGMIALYFLLRGEFGMGLGDPKMLAMIGAFVGLPKTVLALLVASLTGTVLSLALVVAKRAERSTKLPFGVFLALGGALALLVGDQVVGWYLGVGGL